MNFKLACTTVSNAFYKDQARNRPFREEDFITPFDIFRMIDEQKGLCRYCECVMLIGPGIIRTKCPDGLTLERKDSALPHIRDNCVLACAECNKIKNAHKTYDFMKTYGPEIKSKRLRACFQCKQILPVSEFYPKLQTQWRTYCKACCKIENRNQWAIRKARFANQRIESLECSLSDQEPDF